MFGGISFGEAMDKFRERVHVMIAPCWAWFCW
jgi:hypothetical protein